MMLKDGLIHLIMMKRIIDLLIGKNKKVMGKFKDEIDGKIMTKFCGLRAKAYSFLVDGYSDNDYEKKR